MGERKTAFLIKPFTLGRPNAQRIMDNFSLLAALEKWGKLKAKSRINIGSRVEVIKENADGTVNIDFEGKTFNRVSIDCLSDNMSYDPSAIPMADHYDD